MPKDKDALIGRAASSPVKGGARDAIRTFVAFAVAFAFTKLGGDIPGVDMAGVQEALVVIIMSGILAFMGKAMRNNGESKAAVLLGRFI
jgi:hypothetical protein